ncbi:MAG: RNA polymerase [Candidatus Thermoplasmatota archaeon]|jgi:DNA-directed RNA polymerase subunit F|nr:RNA polymerase [Candidatus Thermoplasmatota archaeon]MCL5963468.1 RNA polymerase [Candidatus Thermoplasmatota archaeon]
MAEVHYYTVHEVKTILEEESKQRELSQLAKSTLTYLQKLNTIKSKEIRKMVNELMEVVNIDEKLAVKIADVMPQFPEEVRAIFQKIRNYKDDDIEKVLSIVKKYL